MNHKSDSDPKEKNIVYYDGNCPMCTAIIGRIDNSSKGEEFSMRDITREPLPQGFTRRDVEKEIHIVGADGKVYKNAEAILKVLEEYPTWKLLAWIGHLPGCKQLLILGYNFIAKNRYFLFGPASRVYWLKVVVGLGFIFGLLLSSKLWISSRFYPLTPVLNLFPSIPYPFDWFILFTFFGLLTGVILSSKPRLFIWSFVALICALVFLDQQRLQPWVYQYTFMLAALGLFSWKSDDIENKNATLNVCRFIVASIYFWSGLQKVNMGFINGVFPWMVMPTTQLFPVSIQTAFYTFGIFVPFIEMGIGIGFLMKKFRNIAVWLALIMCAFVLWTIGPFGHNWNNVVWPWNVVMALFVLILFTKTESVTAGQILWIKSHVFHKVILIVFGILPLLYFFNIWDSYLSWSLYSGTTNEAVMYMSAATKDRLPGYIQQFVRVDSSGRNIMPISDWTFKELNVPPYPETRIFKNIARSICATTGNPDDVTLVMRGRLSWFRRDGQQTLNCSQLN